VIRHKSTSVLVGRPGLNAEHKAYSLLAMNGYISVTAEGIVNYLIALSNLHLVDEIVKF